MAFKLTKQQAGNWDRHVQALGDAHELISDSIFNFNQALKEGLAAIQVMVDDYNERLAAAKTFVNELGAEWREQFDEKSESWQDGDSGQEASGVIEAMENWSPEEFELNTVDQLEKPDVNEAEEMEAIAPEG